MLSGRWFPFRKQQRHLLAHGLLVLCIVILATLQTSPAASAPLPLSAAQAGTTIVIDTIDATGSNGCTLPAAIIAANTNAAVGACTAGSGDDIIDLTSLRGTISLSTALPAITSAITFVGPGAEYLTVSGNGVVPAFGLIDAAAVVTIEGLTIADGSSQRGGALTNQGTTTVRSSTLSSNAAEDGGAVWNTGTLTITDSTLSSNTAENGGAIFNSGMLALSSSTVDANQASGQPATFVDGLGGGIFNTSSGTLVIDGSTLSNNQVNGYGGGIASSGTMVLSNSTISGNEAAAGPVAGGSGGALYQFGEAPSASIQHSTIANNNAAAESSTLWVGTGSLEIGHTLLTSAASSEVVVGAAAAVTSLGYNLENGNSSLDYQTSDLPDTNPRLTILADNGGPTLTHALRPDSPAINAGDLAFSPPPANDQRGAARVKGGRIDIGAFELAVPVSAPECADVLEIPRIQCDTLVALYTATGGDTWLNNDGWLATTTPCSWFGLACEAGAVRSINLQQNRLSGTVPPELRTLTGLVSLRLHGNDLQGPVPPELGELASLVNLRLDGNNLRGSIPPRMSNLTNLQTLDLSNNALSGTIPPGLTNLANLTSLRLSDNALSGPIPPGLASLTSLTVLWLHNNALSGTIPPGLASLTSLTDLRLSDNALSGPIPPGLASLSPLAVLRLDQNQLTGPIPPELGNLGNLQQLWLSHNPLRGALPDDLLQLSELEVFAFAETDLCEPVGVEMQTWLDNIPNASRVDPCPRPFTLNTTASALTARPGDTLIYSITLATTVNSTTATLTSTLPAGLTYVQDSLTGGATYSTTTRQVRYSGTVAASQPVTITYQATIGADTPNGSVLANMVQATASGLLLHASIPLAVVSEGDSRTLVLIYYAGDNEQASDGMTVLNSAERAAGNEHAHVLMMLDGPGSSDASLYRLQPDTRPDCPDYRDPTCSGQYVVGENLWPWPEQAADPATLADFIAGGLLAYPDARQVLLIVTGHGSGISAAGLYGYETGSSAEPDPLATLLQDNHPTRDSLSVRQFAAGLRRGLDTAGAAGSPHLQIDGLYLDTGLMGMAEVGTELHDSVGYLLAAANLKWGVSDYAPHIAAIDGTRTTPELLTRWMRNETDALQASASHPYTYVLLDLDRVEQLRTTLDALAATLIDALPAERKRIDAAFVATSLFDSSGDGRIEPGSDTYADIASFAVALESSFLGSTAAISTSVVSNTAAVQAALASTVLTRTYRSGVSPLDSQEQWHWEEPHGGVSIYLPLAPDFEQDDWKRRYYRERHFQFARDGQWDEWLAAYWNDSEPLAAPDCPPGSTLTCGPLPRLTFTGAQKVYLPVLRR